MKNNIFKGILMAAAVVVFGSMTSCMDDAHDDLLGIYAPPTDLTITSAQNVDMVKDGNLRIFTVAFTTQEGVAVNMKLVGNKYFLPSTTYTKAAGAAKNGNYTDGSTVNGSAVADGSLVVIADGDNYTIGNSVLFTADGKAYRMSGKVTLVYEPDPEPIRMSKVLSVNAANPGQLTINLGTDGLVSTPNMYGGADITGEGIYLALDIYSPDGKLYPGTYAASAQGGQIGEGQYGIGWDPGDLWGIGMVFENWGTCLWTIDGGAASAQKISAGDITVELNGGKYTISYKEPGKSERDAIWFEFKGAIEEVVPGDVVIEYLKGEDIVTPGMSADYTTQVSDKHTIVISDKTGALLASLDLCTEIGATSIAGTYAVTANSSDPGVACDGWVWGDWGGGSVIYDGANKLLIKAGTISVADNGGILTITGSDLQITTVDGAPVEKNSFSFDNITFGEIPGGGETPDIEYTEISNFLSSSIGVGLFTLQVGVEGLTTAPNAWGGVDLAGEGSYLKIDFYSEDGTLAEGTYTAAPNDALAAGNFSMGYDVDFFGMQMIWGTAWMTRAADGSETGLKIEDGTIKVEKSGDNYTITLTSSAANVRYTGPINL